MLFASLIQAVLGVVSLDRLLASAKRLRKRLTEPPRKRKRQSIPDLT